MPQIRRMICIGCVMSIALPACSDRTTSRADGSPADALHRSEVLLDARADGTDAGPVPCATDPALPSVRLGALLTLSAGTPEMPLSAAELDSLEMLRVEVNAGCGTIGTPPLGAPFVFHARDTKDDAAITSDLSIALIQQERVAGLVGARGNSTAISLASAAIARGVPYVAHSATAEELTGCTASQLADSKTTKSSLPVFLPGTCWDHKGLFVRVAPRATRWGKTAARYVRESYPASTKASLLHRDDNLGMAISDGFSEHFVAHGGTVTATQPYQLFTSKESFKPLIKALVANDPAVLVCVCGFGDLRNILEAYAELSVDPSFAKPAHYDAIRFVALGTLKLDYSASSGDALAVMSSRAIGLQPGWDPASEGYKRWRAGFKAFTPTFQDKDLFHTLMRAYDAAMILALAITRANSTDPATIKAEYRTVANPPGETIYPGEWAKARALLMQGKKINYEGASGSCDLAENGEILSTPFDVWTVDAKGNPSSLGVYASSD
jgi:branched-chain amino acid transport system substrate-binding protein